nr:class I SAM-dependent methyltransferase [Bacillus sp. FJAT-50079]
MEDVPYEQWLQHVLMQKDRYHVQGNRLLELACGTGELAILLAKEGFAVTGVDLSDEMLSVARDKADHASVELNLFQQNMCELNGLGTFDLITIFCDSLNYLETPEQTKQTFLRVHEHLHEDGLFLFDVHTPFQMESVYENETFALVEEDVAYIWNCFPGEDLYSVEHELTFFVLDEASGQFERFEEIHKQRTYEQADYSNWLKEAGFTILSVTADFTEDAPDMEAKRLFFICKK